MVSCGTPHRCRRDEPDVTNLSHTSIRVVSHVNSCRSNQAGYFHKLCSHFHTIRRDKLLDILQTFSRRIRNADYTPTVRRHFTRTATLNGECHAFATSIGTPQGDSLSPVLFTVYLEAALRDLRSRLPTRPQTDANLPLDVEHADDTDFISTSRLFLDDIERIAPACLAEWSLTINASKTDRSSVCQHADRVDEEWRMDAQTRVATWGSRRCRSTKAARECRIPQAVDCMV